MPPNTPPKLSPTRLRMVTSTTQSEHDLFTVRSFKPGATIVRLLEPLMSCYVILDGVAQEFAIDSRGKIGEEPLRALSEGAVIGAEFFHDSSRGADALTQVIATTDVTVYEIDWDQLQGHEVPERRRQERRGFVFRALASDHRAMKDGLQRAHERIAEVQSSLDVVNRERVEARAQVGEVRSDNTRLAKAIMELREEMHKEQTALERQLLERTYEGQSALSLLELLREVNEQLSETLDAANARWARTLDAVEIKLLLALANDIEQLQFSEDVELVHAAVRVMGALSALKMKLG